MAVQAKYIYLARRHPSLDRESFTARWRRHGALGMSMPRWANVRRYVHCDTLPNDKDIAGIRDDYDGVGMIWYRSLSARTSHTTDRVSQAAMEADEAATFDEPVVNFGVLCAEQVIRDLPPGPCKLIRFMFRPQAVSASLFDAAWERHTVAVLKLAASFHGLGRYVHNRALPAESSGSWGLDVHGIEEMWFDSQQDLARMQAALQAGLDTGADDGLWVRTISVLAHEVVLYNQP